MKKIIWVATAVLVLLGSYQWLCYQEETKLKDKAQPVIDKIDAYQRSHHRLPESLAELDLIESAYSALTYQKLDSNNHYMLYYSIGFDDYYVYYSETNFWIDRP